MREFVGGASNEAELTEGNASQLHQLMGIGRGQLGSTMFPLSYICITDALKGPVVQECFDKIFISDSEKMKTSRLPSAPPGFV